MAEQELTRVIALVQPNAHRNEIAGFREGVLQLKIAAPPVKGKANQELIRFMSDVLGISKASVTIEKGITSRKKTIVITGLRQDEVSRLLELH